MVHSIPDQQSTLQERGLFLIKCPCQTLQNLPYYILLIHKYLRKPVVAYPISHLVRLFFSNGCPWSKEQKRFAGTFGQA